MPGKRSPRRPRIARVCEICSVPFTATAWAVDQGFGRFCTRACRGRGRAIPHPAHACEHCGLAFVPRQVRDTPAGHGRFCSRPCKHAHGRRNVARQCVVCSAAFAVKPAELARGGGHGSYCSRACRSVAQRGSGVPLADRFWAKVRKTPCCWLWVGSLSNSGHGTLGAGGKNGKSLKAHRVSWELHNGPIPVGLHVLHNCPCADQPACVNPSHLWLGTHVQNMADAKAKYRALQERAWCSQHESFRLVLLDRFAVRID